MFAPLESRAPETDGPGTEPVPNEATDSPEPPTPPVKPFRAMTWLERYNALRAENAVLSAGFQKGTLSDRQFARLQGNIDQMALLFAVYRAAGFPDRNLPIKSEAGTSACPGEG